MSPCRHKAFVNEKPLQFALFLIISTHYISFCFFTFFFFFFFSVSFWRVIFNISI